VRKEEGGGREEERKEGYGEIGARGHDSDGGEGKHQGRKPAGTVATLRRGGKGKEGGRRKEEGGRRKEEGGRGRREEGGGGWRVEGEGRSIPAPPSVSSKDSELSESVELEELESELLVPSVTTNADSSMIPDRTSRASLKKIKSSLSSSCYPCSLSCPSSSILFPPSPSLFLPSLFTPPSSLPPPYIPVPSLLNLLDSILPRPLVIKITRGNQQSHLAPHFFCIYQKRTIGNEEIDRNETT
jgi:hypothetical protein